MMVTGLTLGHMSGVAAAKARFSSAATPVKTQSIQPPKRRVLEGAEGHLRQRQRGDFVGQAELVFNGTPGQYEYVTITGTRGGARIEKLKVQGPRKPKDDERPNHTSVEVVAYDLTPDGFRRVVRGQKELHAGEREAAMCDFFLRTALASSEGMPPTVAPRVKRQRVFSPAGPKRRRNHK